jgi:multiple sugar transport system substrate-binding protein
MNQQKEKEISVISVPPWSFYVERAVNLWNDQHPNQRLRLKLKEVDYPFLKETIKATIALGEKLDLCLIDSIWVAHFAENSLIVPLEEIDPNLKNYLKYFYKKVVRSSIWKGKSYIIWAHCDTPFFWYRKDWFEEEKLMIPKTWDGLIKTASYFNQPKIKKKYGIDYPLAFVAGTSAGEETTFTLLPFFWANGGSVIKDKKVILLSKENKETLRFWCCDKMG